MTYRGALLLDLDGTLVDTAADFIALIQAIIKQEQLPELTDQRIRNSVSHGARALTKLTWQIDESHAAFQEKLDLLLNRYQDISGQNARLFDGFNQLFEDLERQHIAWGIVTNKPLRFAKPLLERLNLNPSKQVLICPEHVTHSKPAPEALLLAAKQLQLPVTQCIYAGDHQRDIEAAQNAPMASIACAYGYISDDENINTWQADYIAHNVAELALITQQFFRN